MNEVGRTVGRVFRPGVRRAGEIGQATTEYLMISGIITTVGIIVLNLMQEPLRSRLQRVTEYVIGQALNPPY